MKANRNFNQFLKYKNSNFVARIEKLTSSLGARALRNQGHLLIKPFIKLARLIGLPMNKSVVKTIISYLRWCVTFTRKSNVKALVIYLKVCSVILQKSLGGDYVLNQTPLGCRVAHSRGIPRIIPKLHRTRIRKGDQLIIRLWLTLLALYRVLEVRPKISFASITKKGKSYLLREEYYSRFIKYFDRIFFKDETLRGTIYQLEAELKWSVFSLYKSSPSARPVLTGYERLGGKRSKWREIHEKYSTSFPSIISTFFAWLHPSNQEIYKVLLEWCQLVKRTINFYSLLDMIEPKRRPKGFSGERIVWEHPIIKWTLDEQIRLFRNENRLGQLGAKLEAAGKLRIFAMVDCLTQWVLKPLHDYIFRFLKCVPMDGTFDQLSPIYRLLKMNPKGLYSFDLSSATDRLPVGIQEALLRVVIGERLASLWRRLLVDRPYFIKRKTWKKGKLVEYTDSDGEPIWMKFYYKVGQPMGALSSWAMLALTHHFMVQYSAWKSGYFGIFRAYAVLGDDIVIGDKRVARYYLYLCKQIGLSVSIPKSIRSRKATALEFAKRTFYKGNDVSPVTLKGLLMAQNNVSSLFDFIDGSLVGPLLFLDLYGYGYKAKSLYQKRFSSLQGHKRFRDRLFTFLLLQDYENNRSYTPSMGRISLRERIISRLYRWYNGLVFAETHIRGSPLSFRSLWDRLEKKEVAYNYYLDYRNEDKTPLSGIDKRVKRDDPHSPKSKPFEGWLESYMTSVFEEDMDTISPRSEASIYKPFYHEVHIYLAEVETIRSELSDLWDLSLMECEASDFLTKFIELERRVESLPNSPTSKKKKDPMLKSEWSKLLKFFHFSQGKTKYRQ